MKVNAIQMLEHSLHVARSKATRGDIKRGSDLASIALAKARASTTKTLYQRGADIGRNNKGTVACSDEVRTVSEFDRSTSGRTGLFMFDGKLMGSKHKVRVCKVR